MKDRWHEKGAVMQNLIDAGCDVDRAVQFLEMSVNNEIDLQMKLLAAHRRDLINDIHEKQKCLDCLDFLIYKLKGTLENIEV